MPSDLPIDSDGKCMKCKSSPPEAENLICCTCATPWHVPCLATPLENLTDAVNWTCPDCDGVESGEIVSIGDRNELVEKIREIQKDDTIDDREKARRMQALHSGEEQDKDVGVQDKRKKSCSGGVLDLLDKSFVCSICQQLPDRPVTTPCAHNFCLKCFEKSVSAATAAGMKPRCVNCRELISPKFYSLPKINLKIVSAIRMAKSARAALSGSSQIYHYVHDDKRPIKAYTTERAKRAGKANACSGQIFVTVAPDHFGPIPAENDPITNRGVLVGDSWDDRLDCRQWGAHLPHVAGIAGQSEYGAQSVALSGGYVDDEDHGEWFLYTGSGGRDLSGNKRTNKDQSFDQKFEKMNQALRLSCIKGYPVRVVRSFKEKRSSYAPESGVRYDGVYRIEKCWRKDGIQGFKVCRYLFVRCDNEPAPWTSDDRGDRPRPLPNIPELNGAIDVTERTESPSWDYDEERGWMWKKPPPASRKPLRTVDPIEQMAVRKVIKLAQNNSIMDKLLKEFSCLICNEVMTLALTTPCGHNFCKLCLLDSYADKSFVRERVSSGGRTLRAQKIVKKCPSCPTDISDFLQNPQVNRELNELIETLKRKSEEEKERTKQQLDEEETDMNPVEDTAEASHSAEEMKLSTIQEETDIKADKVEAEAMLDADEKKIDTIKEESGNRAQKRGRKKKNEASVVPAKKMKKEADAMKEDESTAHVAHADSPSSPLNVAAAQDEELE